MRTKSEPLPAGLYSALIAAIVVAAIPVAAVTETALPVYLLVSSVVLIDGLDVAVRLWLRQHHLRTSRDESVDAVKPRPFAILCSIFNHERDLDELLDALEPYRSSVWIIDDASNDGTVTRLRESGWRFVASQDNTKKPGAIRRLLELLPAEIGTVLIMDPDVRLPANLGERIAAFQASGAAAACPKLTVRPDGNLAELQNIEYTLSFDIGRQSLSPLCVTSGISLYDRRSLEEILVRHSLSVYGEDLENAVILLGSGQDIVYDRELVIETDGKADLPGWFSQRVGWSFSLFKVFAEHFPDVLRIMRRSPIGFYQFAIYFGVFSLILWPLKIVSIALLFYSLANGVDELLALGMIANNEFNHPGFFAACYIKYSAIVLVAYSLVSPAAGLLRGLVFMPVYFLYCIALVIPTTVGYLNWMTLRFFGFRIYADHYDDKPVLGGVDSYV